MNLAHNANERPSMPINVRVENITGLCNEGRAHLDRAVTLFAYLDGENCGDDGHDPELEAEMRSEFNRCVAVVAGALRAVVREAAQLERDAVNEPALDVIDAAAEE